MFSDVFFSLFFLFDTFLFIDVANIAAFVAVGKMVYSTCLLFCVLLLLSDAFENSISVICAVVASSHLKAPIGLVISDFVVATIKRFSLMFFSFPFSLLIFSFSSLEKRLAIEIAPPMPADAIATFFKFLPINFTCSRFGIGRCIIECCRSGVGFNLAVFNVDAACLCKLFTFCLTVREFARSSDDEEID